MNQVSWTPNMVCNATGMPAAIIRSYLEHGLVRTAIRLADARRPIRVAFDVGAGFGRLTCVLAETASTVVAFERDSRLLGLGRELNPHVTFVPVHQLDKLPAQYDAADFAMTFTVLQHLSSATCRRIIEQLKRIVRDGHILLVEDTNANAGKADLAHDDTGDCCGRPVAWYRDVMNPWALLQTWTRRVEPTYPATHVGTAMLFGTLPE